MDSAAVRTVTVQLTHEGRALGRLGPFPVSEPWWCEVGEISDRLTAELGVPVHVLRLLRVEGADGGAPRGGHVHYQAEALRPPRSAQSTGTPTFAVPAPHPLRMAWATPDGLRRLLRWAADALAEPATVRQQRSWNLSGLFRLTTSEGDFWLKAVPPFAAQEGAALRLVASVAPGLVPGVVAAAPGRTVLRHAPGEDLWQPESAEPLVRAVRSWVAAQAALAGSAARAGLPDLREHLLQERAHALVRSLPDLTAEERRTGHELADSWPELRACGLPTTVVHGDFHPGNLRGAPDGGDPVVLDFADAHLGNPALDGFRLWDYSPEPLRAAVADAWVDAWRSHAPGADPERALALARRLGPLQYALRYQEFLDGVEPSERVYHEDDPLDCVRAAVSSAPPSSNSLTS